MEGTIQDICEVVDEVVEEKMNTVLEDEVVDENMDSIVEEEVIGVQPADCLEDQGQEMGLDEGQKENETDSDMDDGSREDDIAWDSDRDSMDYWLQEFEEMLKDYKPVTKKMSELKRRLGKPKTLLVAGGGLAAFGLALVGVVAGKKSRSRSVIHTLPVQSPPERKEEPMPAPKPPEQRTPPAVPWPFFYFR